MLLNAEDVTLISVTVFLLANCILLGLHDNTYCGRMVMLVKIYQQISIFTFLYLLYILIFWYEAV